jgi:hypothetical protein
MNFRLKTLLLAAAFTAAGPAFAAQHADLGDYFEMQREITDGYYAAHPDSTEKAPIKPQTVVSSEASRGRAAISP